MLEIHLGKRCYLVDHSCIFLQSLTYNLEKKKKKPRKKKQVARENVMVNAVHLHCLHNPQNQSQNEL